MNATGWYADVDTSSTLGYPWQPVLQCPDGTTCSIDIWFFTHEECAAFIRSNILGQGMYPPDRADAQPPSS